MKFNTDGMLDMYIGLLVFFMLVALFGWVYALLQPPGDLPLITKLLAVPAVVLIGIGVFVFFASFSYEMFTEGYRKWRGRE